MKKGELKRCRGVDAAPQWCMRCKRITDVWDDKAMEPPAYYGRSGWVCRKRMGK